MSDLNVSMLAAAQSAAADDGVPFDDAGQRRPQPFLEQRDDAVHVARVGGLRRAQLLRA